MGLVGVENITGFTIFKVKAGFQMSVRRNEDPTGWHVEIVPEDRARAILSVVETSGLVEPLARDAAASALIDAMADAVAAREGLTAAIRARSAL